MRGREKNFESNLGLVVVLVLESKGLYWAIAFNIRTPPVEDSPFLLTPEDWLKLHSPVKTAIRYGFTPEEYWFTLKNFVKIKTSPSKNSIFFYSTPKEILSFYNLPLENSMVPQPVGCGY